MEGLLTIESIKEVAGYTPPFNDPDRYNGSKSVITRLNEFKSLHIKGLIDGKKISFFSPTVEITKTVGMLNYMLCPENSWFEIVNGQQTAHRGDKRFDGGKYPNIAIDDHSRVEIKVKVGETYRISYSVKEEKYGYLFINRVRIIAI